MLKPKTLDNAWKKMITEINNMFKEVPAKESKAWELKEYLDKSLKILKEIQEEKK